MNYLKRLMDRTDPSASLRHAAYAVVVACGCGWLTFGVRHLDGNWVAAFAALLAAVTGAKIAHKESTPGSGASAGTPPAGDGGGPNA